MKGPLSKTKVVIRHLPPSLSRSDLFQQIDDRFSGLYQWSAYRPGKISRKHQIHSRAYIDFNRAEDVLEFADFLDGRVFVNEKGVQYKTIVEHAPSQRVPKPSIRRDGREGTLIKDPDYLELLKLVAKPPETLPSAEIQLDRKEAEQAGAAKESPIITPLMEYVLRKRAVGNGAQGSVVIGKINKGSGVRSSQKQQPNSSSTKRVSEKIKYVLNGKTNNTSRNDKPTFIVVPRQEDQLATSIEKETTESEAVSAIEGSVSGIPVVADSGKKKTLLLKEKRHETTQQQTSFGNFSVSGVPKQNQSCDGSRRLIRSILLNNEGRQGQSSTAGQPQQKIQILNSENLKQLPRNMRGLNGDVFHHEPNSLNSEGDRKKVLEDKFMKRGQHIVSNVSEKQEKRTRNKDRPDRGVWAPLCRADVSLPTQLTSDTVAGSHKSFCHHGTAHNIKYESPQNAIEGKSSKRGAAVHGAHEGGRQLNLIISQDFMRKIVLMAGKGSWKLGECVLRRNGFKEPRVSIRGCSFCSYGFYMYFSAFYDVISF